jgi:hypothetical protein
VLGQEGCGVGVWSSVRVVAVLAVVVIVARMLICRGYFDGVMDIFVAVVVSAHALGEQSFNKKGLNADHFELIFSLKKA